MPTVSAPAQAARSLLHKARRKTTVCYEPEGKIRTRQETRIRRCVGEVWGAQAPSLALSPSRKGSRYPEQRPVLLPVSQA